MSPHISGKLSGVAALAALLAAVGCSSSPTPSVRSTGSPHASSPGVATSQVRLETTPVGKVPADSSGRTLYVLSTDTTSHQSCAGGCLSVWPAVKAGGTLEGGSGVTARFGTTHFSGGTQLTVDGRPVFLYSGDSGPGTANGSGIHSFGGVWYALMPSGQPMTHTLTSTSPSGGGYG
jgi:predicted lipoprotein with Yx(FWY)xxD motif